MFSYTIFVKDSYTQQTISEVHATTRFETQVEATTEATERTSLLKSWLSGDVHYGDVEISFSVAAASAS